MEIIGIADLCSKQPGKGASSEVPASANDKRLLRLVKIGAAVKNS